MFAVIQEGSIEDLVTLIRGNADLLASFPRSRVGPSITGAVLLSYFCWFGSVVNIHTYIHMHPYATVEYLCCGRVHR